MSQGANYYWLERGITKIRVIRGPTHWAESRDRDPVEAARRAAAPTSGDGHGHHQQRRRQRGGKGRVAAAAAADDGRPMGREVG